MDACYFIPGGLLKTQTGIALTRNAVTLTTEPGLFRFLPLAALRAKSSASGRGVCSLRLFLCHNPATKQIQSPRNNTEPCPKWKKSTYLYKRLLFPTQLAAPFFALFDLKHNKITFYVDGNQALSLGDEQLLSVPA